MILKTASQSKRVLTIMSTSERLSRELQGLRCPGNHDHQVIEGSITVDGQRMNRSAFTERYPRRFARKIAGILCSRQLVMSPKILFTEHEEDLDSILVNDDNVKRRRIATAPKVSRTIPVNEQPPVKRLRLSEKQTPVDHRASWLEIFTKVDKMCLE